MVNGIGDGLFDPESNVTREQFITMMMRMWGKQDVAELPYTDAGDISPYALTAMKQAQAAGLIKGYEDLTLLPLKALTRAEAVALAVRLLSAMDN